MKKIAIYILCLIPWLLTSLVPFNEDFYNSLTLPFFTPPKIFFSVAWTIVYILIAFSIYKIIINYGLKNTPKSYKKSLIVNYIFNQSFSLVFFLLENTFLGFISSIGTFVTSLFLYNETNDLDEKSTKYLDPYVLLGLFATVLSLTIYILNVK